MSNSLQQKSVSFFERVLQQYPSSVPARSVVVAHLLEGQPWFISAVSRIAKVECVLAKPRTARPRVRSLLEQEYSVRNVTREALNTPEKAVEFLGCSRGEAPLVLLD